MDPVTDPEVTSVAGGKDPAVQETLGWRTEIPEDRRGHEAFAPYKTKDELWNGHIEAVSKVKDLEGKLVNSIPKLSENATEEQKAAYRAAMGVPAKAEEYDIPVPEGESTELADAFRQFAITAGLPKDIAKSTVEWWNGVVAKQQENYAKELTAHTEAVKTKWGADYPKNAETVKTMFQAFKDKGIGDLAMIEVKSPDGKPMYLGNHPVAMEFFLECGKLMLPDSMVRGGSGQQTSVAGEWFPNSPNMPK